MAWRNIAGTKPVPIPSPATTTAKSTAPNNATRRRLLALVANRPNYPNELLHRGMASLWLLSLRPLPTTLSLQMEIWLPEPETTPGLLHRTVARHRYWLVVGNLGGETLSLRSGTSVNSPPLPSTSSPALQLVSLPALPPPAGGLDSSSPYASNSRYWSRSQPAAK